MKSEVGHRDGWISWMIHKPCGHNRLQGFLIGVFVLQTGLLKA